MRMRQRDRPSDAWKRRAFAPLHSTHTCTLSLSSLATPATRTRHMCTRPCMRHACQPAYSMPQGVRDKLRTRTPIACIFGERDQPDTRSSAGESRDSTDDSVDSIVIVCGPRIHHQRATARAREPVHRLGPRARRQRDLPCVCQRGQNQKRPQREVEPHESRIPGK